jgi:hypothetical protein
MRRSWLAAAIATWAALSAGAVPGHAATPAKAAAAPSEGSKAPAAVAPTGTTSARGLALSAKPWTGDFDQMPAYNAGPGNISRMRKLATERGLDPDKWFNNVELVTAEKIGIETTTYVRNIYKYYVAYRLATDQRDAQEKLKGQMRKSG